MTYPPFSNGEPAARVLLTGFGPFPSVPDNASARLVAELALRAQARFPQCKIASEVLPTEWTSAPDRLCAVLDRLKPDIVISFGVARDAAGFRLEARATNACRPMLDAAGHLPGAAMLRSDGPEGMACSAPLGAIAARLSQRGLPVSISDDAGAYLCNAAYYTALHDAACCGSRAQILFVHIPDDLSCGPLPFERAIEGALEILAACVESRMSEM